MWRHSADKIIRILRDHYGCTFGEEHADNWDASYIVVTRGDRKAFLNVSGEEVIPPR